MEKKTSATARLQIISALTWAAVILGSGYAINLGNTDIVLNIMIAGATTHFLLLNRITSISYKEKKSCKKTDAVKV